MNNQTEFSGRTNYHGNEISWKLDIKKGACGELAEVTISQPRSAFGEERKVTTIEVPPIQKTSDVVCVYMAVLLTHFVRNRFEGTALVSPSQIWMNR